MFRRIRCECGWAGSSRGRKHSATGALEVGTLRQRYGETEHARRPRPRQTCTSDRMHRRNLRCPLQSKGNERPGHLKRPTTTVIRPCFEISRPKRRNGAAYLHRHRRSRTGDTQLSPMGVTRGSAALGPCSLRIGSREPPVRHGPIVLCCPGNGPERHLKHKTHVRTHVDPGRAPRRHPRARPLTICYSEFLKNTF